MSTFEAANPAAVDLDPLHFERYLREHIDGFAGRIHAELCGGANRPAICAADRFVIDHTREES